MRALRLLCASSVVFAATLAAHATPITFTETATASGYDGFAFYTNQTVTLTAYANTSNIVEHSYSYGNYYTLPASLVTVEVGTGPIYDLTDSFQIFDTQFADTAGLTDLSEGEDVLDTTANVFAHYALTGTGTAGGTTTYKPGESYASTHGYFYVNSTTGRATFTATPTIAATPEPSSLVLLGTGLLGALGAARRKFVKA